MKMKNAEDENPSGEEYQENSQNQRRVHNQDIFPN